MSGKKDKVTGVVKIMFENDVMRAIERALMSGRASKKYTDALKKGTRKKATGGKVKKMMGGGKVHMKKKKK